MQPFTYPANVEKAKLIRKKTTTTVFLGRNAMVNTYTVYPTDKTGNILNRGPDDNTYKDLALADLVPRGCSDLFIDDKLVAQVRGARKFFGTNDIIDEDEPPFEGADEKDIEDFAKSHESDVATIAAWNDANTLRVDFWEKANGKFVICTLFELDGDLYIFGGSKNVHVCRALNSRDIPLPRDLHHVMLDLVIVDITRCENPRSLIGKQIMGEYCDGKHMVYTNTPYMVYFDESLPAQFRKPMKILPSVNSIPSDEILISLRRLIELEGVVLYYTNTKTGQFIRIKHKTIWYVIIRSWREIIGRHKKGNTTPNKLVELLKSRVQSRSDQFLHLSAEELTMWKDLATTFVTHLTESKYAYSDVNPMSDVGMAKIWHELMIESSNVKQENVNSVYFNSAEIKNEHLTSTPTPTNTPASETLEPTIEQILIQPVYYYAVSYAAFVSNVLVIMQGPPGSGKSTVVSQLKKSLQSMQITADSFSTDDYFTKDGTYHFDPKQLGVYHAKNLEAACLSTAQVVIIDNTNLTPGEYAKYKANMLDRIVIVLSCKAESPETLLRNKHGVPIDSLKKMCAKYSPAVPVYIGGFVSKNHLLPWKDEIKQIQPSHLTELFVGGNSKKIANYDFSTIMQSYTFTITGISKSAAGVGLVCTTDIRCESTTPHITLAVNDGANTVDVGKQISIENTTRFYPPHVMFAIRLPMF